MKDSNVNILWCPQCPTDPEGEGQMYSECMRINLLFLCVILKII